MTIVAATRAKSVSIATSVLFNIEEDLDSTAVESSPGAVSHTVRTLSSPTRNASKSNGTARPGAVSSATTVQSNDDLSSSQSGGDNNAFPSRPYRRRARSRKPSIYATWTCGSVALSNAALRLLTSAVAIPAVVAALVLSPRQSLAFLCAALVCVSLYEFAWLAYRIHRQLLVTYNYYERKVTGDTDDSNENDDLPLPSFVSGNTQSTTSFSTSVFTHNERDSFEDPVLTADVCIGATTNTTAEGTTAAGDGSTRQLRAATSAIDPALDSSARDLLAGVAAACFRGRIVVARVACAVPLAALWSAATHLLYTNTTFPVAAMPHAFVDWPFGLWAANLLAAICALAAPTASAAVALVVQKELFTVMLLNTTNCPLTARVCDAAATTATTQLAPLQTFVMGVVLLLVMRSVIASSPADLVVAFMLDVLGCVYIVGSFALLAAVVDTSDRVGDVFVNVLLLLLGVVWTAELAGYCCDAVMYHFRIHHVQLFPPWLALKFDIEAAICSVGVGVAAMLVGSEALRVPGTVLAKITCALLAVLAGRLGRLFLSLLKKAAGVRWSSYLLPGYGGLLDAVSMLLFATLVFAQYFVYVGTLSDAVTQQPLSHASQGRTIDFSTAIASGSIADSHMQ